METLKLSVKYFAIIAIVLILPIGFIIVSHSIGNQKEISFSFLQALFTEEYNQQTLLVSFGIIIAPFAFIGILFILFKTKKETYGSAKFATKLKSRLKAKEGVILGTFKGKEMISEGWTPVLAYAPQGSGKTVSISIPNLLTSKHSFIVNDVKRELWYITAGFRSKFSECYLFAPLHEESHCWNPFDELSILTREAEKVTMIQKIASELYSPGKEKQNQSFYDSASRLFVAVALYLHTTGSILTLAECKKFVTPEHFSFQDFLKQILEENNNINSVVKSEFQYFSHVKEETLNVLLNFYDKPLSIFLNEDLVRVTSKSDFLLSDIRKKRMTIYKGADPSALSVVSGIFSIFNALFYSLMTVKEPGENEPFGVYDLQDEFISQGRLNTFMDKIAYLRSYKIRPILIVQSPSQIKGVYSIDEYETIVQSSSDKIIYTPNANNVAKELSEFLGNYTIKQKKKTQQSKGNYSRTEEEKSRALMLPQEILKLDDKLQIVLSYNSEPILSKKIFSHKINPYKSRSNLPLPPVPKISSVIIKANNFIYDIKSYDFNTNSDADKIAESVDEY